MNYIRQATLMNNEAVSLLDCGASARAFRTFKTAFSILNNINVSSHRTLASDSSDLSVSNLFHASEPSQKFFRRSMSVTPFAISSFEESGYFIYSRPFLFDLEKTRANIQVYSAAIMFNMALTLHLKDKNTCDKAKIGAIRLYDMALSILQNLYNDPECMCILVATLNNKAHIHYELCQFDEAKNVHNVLVNAIRSQETRDIFDLIDIEQFLQNELLVSASATACAA